MGWLPKNKIVVPVDFSDESLAAIDTALMMVESAENIHIVHVLRELSPLEPGETYSVSAHFRNSDLPDKEADSEVDWTFTTTKVSRPVLPTMASWA